MAGLAPVDVADDAHQQERILAAFASLSAIFSGLGDVARLLTRRLHRVEARVENDLLRNVVPHVEVVLLDRRVRGDR